MRISDVINELEAIKRMEGNVEVKLRTPDDLSDVYPMNFEYDREEGVAVIIEQP